MRLGAARAGNLPRRRLGGVEGARPNSLLAGFPQLHVRSLTERPRDEAETQRPAGARCLAARRASSSLANPKANTAANALLVSLCR